MQDIYDRFQRAKRALFDKYYQSLNGMQKKAVYTVNGPLLILAGAGSGKTTVLVKRIAHIIRFGNAYLSDRVPGGVDTAYVEELERAIDLPAEQIGHYPEIRSKRKRMEEIRKNPYYNALQVKYGYAVTCHKAQGGQWKHVFLDQGYVTADMMNADYYRWLYTAFTRATEKLYLVNWKV